MKKLIYVIYDIMRFQTNQNYFSYTVGLFSSIVMKNRKYLKKKLANAPFFGWQ
jgi:hypothetical protein